MGDLAAGDLRCDAALAELAAVALRVVAAVCDAARPACPPSGVSLKQRGGLRDPNAGSSLAIKSAKRAICSAPVAHSAP